MSQAGRINFSRMESVTFGKPAAEVVAEEARKVGAERVFLMVSNTLNNKTDEIEKVRRALGNLCAGTYDTMSPHTPREIQKIIVSCWNQTADGRPTFDLVLQALEQAKQAVE